MRALRLRALAGSPLAFSGELPREGEGVPAWWAWGGALFKWMAAPSSRLPPDSDILSDLPSWLSPPWWLPSPGSRRPTTRGNLGDRSLCRLGFCCNEKRRCSPTCRLFCISRGKEHCGSGSLCLSQAAQDTGGGEGLAQGHGSGPTLKMGKAEAQSPPWSPPLDWELPGLTGGSPPLRAFSQRLCLSGELLSLINWSTNWRRPHKEP